jgi:hypothetical protein
VTTPLGQLKQGKDDEKATFKLVNELRRFAYPGAGTFWCIASEQMAAFVCTSRDAATETMVLARADGSNYAVGVLAAAVRVGELAQVVTEGVILGAVSGRTAGDVVWVGTDGTLAFSAPASGYVLPIAVCINATDIYVNPQTPAATPTDSVSFHFYINDTTGALGISGTLAPSSTTTLNILGGIYYSPSTTKVFRRGSLQMRIITNAMVGGETYNISCQGNISGPASASVTATGGSAGTLTADFTTGSTSAAEVYLLQVSSNANTKNVEYSLVWRMFT